MPETLLAIDIPTAVAFCTNIDSYTSSHVLFIVGMVALTKQVQWLHQLERLHCVIYKQKGFRQLQNNTTNFWSDGGRPLQLSTFGSSLKKSCPPREGSHLPLPPLSKEKSSSSQVPTRIGYVVTKRVYVVVSCKLERENQKQFNYVSIYVDVSNNNGTPTWMVYNGKPMKTLLKWMIWGFSHIFGNTHVSMCVCVCVCVPIRIFNIFPTKKRKIRVPSSQVAFGLVAQLGLV